MSGMPAPLAVLAQAEQGRVEGAALLPDAHHAQAQFIKGVGVSAHRRGQGRAGRHAAVGYNGLVGLGHQKHLRIDHSADTATMGSHINGIENYRAYAKVRLTRCRGMHPHMFLFHLKECEFRLNHRGDNLHHLLLDMSPPLIDELVMALCYFEKSFCRLGIAITQNLTNEHVYTLPSMEIFKGFLKIYR